MGKPCVICGKNLNMFTYRPLKPDKSWCCKECLMKFVKAGGQPLEATVEKVKAVVLEGKSATYQTDNIEIKFPMTTAEDIKNYVLKYRAIDYIHKLSNLDKYDKSIALLLSKLKNGEGVNFACFCLGYGGTNFVLFVTTQRIIYGSVDALIGDSVKTISIDESYEVTCKVPAKWEAASITGTITIQVKTQTFAFSIDKNETEKVCNLIDEAIGKISVKQPQVVVNNSLSAADELKKFKDLLDSGIISQEEFDIKKKELLGI